MFSIDHTLAIELRRLHPNNEIPLRLFTDSKRLFDVIKNGSKTYERRLILDASSTRQDFKRHEISDIGFVRSVDNADGLNN